jgi:hypothetical protein
LLFRETIAVSEIRGSHCGERDVIPRSMGEKYQRFGGAFRFQVPPKRGTYIPKYMISQNTVEVVYSENR